MTRTAFVADTGVFVRAGGPDNEKYQRLRSAVVGGGVTLRLPRRVYAELGGDPHVDTYPSGSVVEEAIAAEWVTVADELDYTNSLVSTVMDQARRFVAAHTGRDEDLVEKADTALLGLSAQLLDSGHTRRVVLLTTDKPAGEAALALFSNHGFDDQVDYRYVGREFLASVEAETFR